MPLFAKERGLKKMKRTAENVKRIIPAYEIIKIVKSGVTGRHLKQMLEDYHSADIAKAMESLTPEERRKIKEVLVKFCRSVRAENTYAH